MRKIIQITKEEALTRFAKSIPNASKMFIDWGRNLLLVQFDNIHSKEFKIDEILDRGTKNALSKGIILEFINKRG
jgi:hypothetical protein